MMEVPFHWSMVAYYACVDIAAAKGALQAYTFGSNDPENAKTNRMINGSLTYITIWNMIVHQVYFLMCCREHLLSGKEKQLEVYRRTRQVLLSSILFPTTFVVAIVYWYEYWRSPTLIFGDILPQVYPFWMDHTMHTLIVPIALVELYLSSTRERDILDGGAKMKGWLTCNAFYTIYITVVLVARLIRGVWPYPFLDPVNEGSPSLFFLYLYVAGGFWFYVGQHLTHQIGGGGHDGGKRISQQ